jgi:hypothetical protein
MPDEIDEMLQSEGIFQQHKAKNEDADEKRSGPPLEDSVLDWLEGYGDRQHRYAVQEIRMLRAEVAALKANDPLAEMWRELAEYQPQADRDGHGESWRRMCEERTEQSARDAAWDASAEARAAARAAGYAARDAACAVAEIRRGKEVQR